MSKKQTIDDFVKELSEPDAQFFGTKIDEEQYKKYERIKYFAKEIKANENYFINVHIECQEELPNTKPNGIVIVNILAPANINNKVIKDCLSKMIDLSDNLSIAVTEREAHKIIRFGFGVRDIWVDARGGN
jgi:regulator of RNase E activity RraB